MVAIPGAVVMAYKERESIFKTIIYALAFSMLIYLLWKILNSEWGKEVKEMINKVKGKYHELFTETRPDQYAHTVKVGNEEYTEVEGQLIEKPTPKESLDKAIEPVKRMIEETKKAITGEKEEKAVERRIKLTIPKQTIEYKLTQLEKTTEEERKGIEEFKKKKIYIEKPTMPYSKLPTPQFDGRNLHLIENLNPNRFYKIVWLDKRGLRHERIMKGADIKADKTIYKVISVLPMPRTYKPTPTPLPIGIKPIDRALPIRRLPIAV